MVVLAPQGRAQRGNVGNTRSAEVERIQRRAVRQRRDIRNSVAAREVERVQKKAARQRADTSVTCSQNVRINVCRAAQPASGLSRR